MLFMEKKFNSPYDWEKFCHFKIKTNRYVLNKKWENFIDVIISSANKRERIINKGKVYARARIGDHLSDNSEENGHMIKIDNYKNLMAPPNEKTKNFRANPRGISYLYLSNKIETAILEVGAWIGQDISVGYFEIKKKLKCIDISKDKKKIPLFRWFGKEPSLTSDENEKFVWGSINSSFSKPIRSGEETINYIPTQHLSELFKNMEYDGIIYESSLMKEGYNIVLFNPANAFVRNAEIFRLDSIEPSISQVG